MIDGLIVIDNPASKQFVTKNEIAGNPKQHDSYMQHLSIM